MNIGVLILTSLWRPVAGESSQLLLYTATWGVVDGTLQSQVQGTYRTLSLAFCRVTHSLAFGQGHTQASLLARVTSKPRFRAVTPSLAFG